MGFKSTNGHHTSWKGPRLWKRFVSPALTGGGFEEGALGGRRLRTRRSTAEECEKLQLCKLHARSSRNFIAAFELYFVNKENARLWDHRAHSIADCERTYTGCRGGPPPRAPARAPPREVEFVDTDYESY
ncbi:uncharacterized protein LOC119692421 [Plutella xylostella]|uniref:uncharacterized protein LOC119692421 n=1 Tax=Plutella xylostella TaxID=51655 RepID=UPI0020326BD4|nr:uncharacterized protein LOC119692421 [Plutella xylostella]